VKRLSTRISVFSGLLAALLLGVFATSVLLANREAMDQQMAKDLAKEEGVSLHASDRNSRPTPTASRRPPSTT
jgi:hypothetical protein